MLTRFGLRILALAILIGISLSAEAQTILRTWATTNPPVVVSNIVSAVSSTSAQASTNGLGSAAFMSIAAFDGAGTANSATGGLGSAAFTPSGAYDAIGAAQNATNTARLMIQLGSAFDPLNAAQDATNTARLTIQLSESFDAINAALNATNTARLASQLGESFDAIGAATGSTNGLGSAAFTASSSYDAAGAAQNSTNSITSAWIQGKFPSLILTNGGTVEIDYSNIFRAAFLQSGNTVGNVLQKTDSSGNIGDATKADVQSLFPGTLVTNKTSFPMMFSNTVSVDIAHQLILSNATIGRVLLSRNDSGVTNVSASGSVPVNADGTATTAAQVPTPVASATAATTSTFATGNGSPLTNGIAPQFGGASLQGLDGGITNAAGLTIAAQLVNVTNTTRLAANLATTFLGLHATADAATTATSATTATTATTANATSVGATLNTANATALTNNIVSSAANYAILSTDSIILLNGARTATLPTAVGLAGKTFTIVCASSGTNGILLTGGQTINGFARYTNTAQFKFTTVISDGANYRVIGQN